MALVVIAVGSGWNEREYTRPATSLIGCRAVSAAVYICLRSEAERPWVRVTKRARLPGGELAPSSMVKSVRFETRRVLESWGWMSVKGLKVGG